MKLKLFALALILTQTACSIQGSVIDLSEADLPQMKIDARGFVPLAQQKEVVSGYTISASMDYVEGKREEHSGYVVNSALQMTIQSQ